MQQHLPLAVLKHAGGNGKVIYDRSKVATAPTACGIETITFVCGRELDAAVATAPTACGIETCGKVRIGRKSFLLQQHLPLAVLKPKDISLNIMIQFLDKVATAPTACGIETPVNYFVDIDAFNELQQHLPLAVLKPPN